MPSKPLLGMPEVVGTSAAVMAMRRTFCCCAAAGAAPAWKAAARAAAAKDLRNARIVLCSRNGREPSAALRLGNGRGPLPQHAVLVALLEVGLPQLARGGVRQLVHELHRVGHPPLR